MASKSNINRYLKQSLDHIFQNNKKWVSSKKETDASFFVQAFLLDNRPTICK
jgi:hypothetical protein